MTPDSSNQDVVDDLFGELDEATAAALHERLAVDPEQAAEARELAELVNLLTVEPPEVPTKLDDDRLAAIVAEAAAPTTAPKRPWWPVLLPLAAAAAVVLLGTWLNRPAHAPREIAATPAAPTTEARKDWDAAADYAAPAPEAAAAESEAPALRQAGGFQDAEGFAPSADEIVESRKEANTVHADNRVAPARRAAEKVAATTAKSEEVQAGAAPAQPAAPALAKARAELDLAASDLAEEAKARPLAKRVQPTAGMRSLAPRALQADAATPTIAPPPELLATAKKSPAGKPANLPFTLNDRRYYLLVVERQTASKLAEQGLVHWRQPDPDRTLDYLVIRAADLARIKAVQKQQ